MIDLAKGENRMHSMLPVRLAASALLLAVIVGAWAPRAGGQADAPEETSVENIGANVTAVDATSSPVEISLIGLDPGIAASELTLTVDAAEVDVANLVSSSAENRPTELVLVVDTNVRAATGDVLELVKDQLIAEVSDLPSETAIALISAGDSALVSTSLTTDRGKIEEAIADLSVKNGSALFNAVDRASLLFSSDLSVVRTLLIVSTGRDTGSEVTLAEAQVGIVQKGVQVVSVGYQGGEPQLLDAVSRTAGLSIESASPASIEADIAAAVTFASDRTLVSFVEPEVVGARTGVVVTVDERTTSFSYPTGVLTSSSLQLAPLAVEGNEGLAFFKSSAGLYVALGLAFLGITLGVWSLGSIVAGGDATLEGMLARYTDGSVEQVDGEAEEMIVQSALLQRAVDFSESFAEKQGFLSRTEDLLERANLPLRAGEGMFILAAITVLSTSLGLVITRSIIAAGLFAMFAIGLSFFIVRLLGRRRFKTFESQLPDTLQLLSGTLRAGYSLPQGLEAVSTEIADPMGQELRRAMTEARLGRDLEEALGGIAERMTSADFAWTVMAIGIQREVGGNLNELLMSVADTMVARERLKREVAGLTAEGRVSAAVLSFLPPGLGAIMWVLNPDYVSLLFTELIGNIMLGLGVVSALVGLAWMKKVITVDV